MPFTDSLEFVEIIRADKYTLTATPSDVVVGKLYVGSTRQIESGNLPLLEEHSDITLLSGEQITIPYGKNPVQYIVRAATMDIQTVGTATAPDIKDGKTAWVNGVQVVGSMPIIEDYNVTLLAGESHIPALGWHSGASVVRAENLAVQTVGNASAEHILQEYIAWVNGQEITGAMVNNAPVTVNLQSGETYQVPEGYHNGEDLIIAPSLLSVTPGTATSEDIKDGEVAWVNGQEIIGSMPIIAPSAHALAFNGTYYIPQGYHDGNGYVTQNLPAIEDQIVISPAFEDQIVSAAGKYMVQDILVNGIDALNYQRPSTEWLINEEEFIEGQLTGEYKLAVDNWHDNATLNVYYFELGTAITGLDIVDPNNGTIHGVLFIDWKNSNSSTYTYHFEEDNDSGPSRYCDVSLSLEPDTNAHTFKFEFQQLTNSSDNRSYEITYFRVRELFHARQFGDDHDTDENITP